MEMNAAMSEILVGIVRTKIQTKIGGEDNRVLPLSQTMTTMVNNGTLSIGDGRGLVSQLQADRLELTFELRSAIRAIANGKIGTLKAEILETLMRRDLLKYDGQSLALTAAGLTLS